MEDVVVLSKPGEYVLFGPDIPHKSEALDAAAMATTQVMSALLYEVTPTDPATFAAAVATVGGAAFAACCAPAVKASLIDPLVALRCE